MQPALQGRRDHELAGKARHLLVTGVLHVSPHPVLISGPFTNEETEAPACTGLPHIPPFAAKPRLLPRCEAALHEPRGRESWCVTSACWGVQRGVGGPLEDSEGRSMTRMSNTLGERTGRVWSKGRLSTRRAWRWARRMLLELGG